MQTSFGVAPKTAIYYGTSTLGLDSRFYGNYFALLPMCFDAMLSIVEYLLYISTYHLGFSPKTAIHYMFMVYLQENSIYGMPSSYAWLVYY